MRNVAKAIERADKHSRSLDIMHVAAAILLGAETFLSFDERQKQVAKAEGLVVRP